MLTIKIHVNVMYANYIVVIICRKKKTSVKLNIKSPLFYELIANNGEQHVSTWDIDKDPVTMKLYGVISITNPQFSLAIAGPKVTRFTDRNHPSLGNSRTIAFAKDISNFL